MRVQIFIFVLALIAVSAEPGIEPSKNLKPTSPLENPIEPEQRETSEPLEPRKRDGKVFFAFYSQTSVTILTTTTLNAISTCFSTVNAVLPCVGRKRRRSFEEAFLEKDEENLDLDSSLAEVPTDSQGREKVGKKLTLWSTSFSTLTVTTTSFVAGTTATVSLACIIAGNLGIAQCLG